MTITIRTWDRVPRVRVIRVQVIRVWLMGIDILPGPTCNHYYTTCTFAKKGNTNIYDHIAMYTYLYKHNTHVNIYGIISHYKNMLLS
jgi:hypothetical protein